MNKKLENDTLGLCKMKKRQTKYYHQYFGRFLMMLMMEYWYRQFHHHSLLFHPHFRRYSFQYLNRHPKFLGLREG